jgi:eukaryotic-like serine/threonine-protein kinase
MRPAAPTSTRPAKECGAIPDPALGTRIDRASTLLTRLLLPLAAAKLLAGLVGALFAPSLLRPLPEAPLPAAIHLVTLTVFGSAAVWLILGGRADRRALYLGAVFALIAAAFCERLVLGGLAGSPPAAVAAALTFAAGLQVEAFLPVCLWLFAREFPRSASFSRATVAATVVSWVSLVVGSVIFAGNLLGRLVPTTREAAGGILQLLEKSDYGFFWAAIFLLILPAFPFIAWKARRAEAAERRRASLFVAAFILGLGPIFLEVVLEALIPPYARWIRRPAGLLIGGLFFYPLLLSIPLTTAYSVTVHRVLDVRLIVRRALQYLLARYVVIVLAALPFVGLLIHLYRHRNEPVGELLTGPGGIFFLSTAALGLVALRMRGQLLPAIDRRFFREQYDARRILGDLVRQSRSAESPDGLASLLEQKIDEALHLESIAVLVLDGPSDTFVSPSHRSPPLPAAAALASFTTGSSQPLDVDLEAPGATLARLPESDRRWLAEGGFRLLLPLLASDGSPLGLIALGGKRSELPYAKEDRTLLADIAVSGSMALEHLIMRSSGAFTDSADGRGDGERGWAASGADEPAGECPTCFLLHPAAAQACGSCGAPLIPARVPFVLHGKFRMDRRVGAGGMGVVYQATDLLLGRPVAIKTLPRLSPERSLRMRREARAMAAVAHPGLALIFGAETWRGTPLLVLELLEGGSLGDRLRERRLTVGETLGLGAALCAAVGVLHRAGILHRDIKPSNIGYTRDGQPKLLDFGLARILEGDREPLPGGGAGLAEGSGLSQDETLTETLRTSDGHLIGTPLYMSPEATLGETPDPSFDLWALSLVLWEALTGKHPFTGENRSGTRDRILAARLPELRELRPECPQPVAAFFDSALHRRASRRPPSADEMGRRLAALGEELARAEPS